MARIRTTAAAAILGVSPNTLRSWERRFGHPTPTRSAGGHRHYEHAEIEALRQALEETHNVSSAINLARARGEGPPSATRFLGALSRFDEERANRLLEESLAVRSVERTVDELLLPAVAALGEGDAPTPEYACAFRLAAGWMAALRRLALADPRREALILFDAAGPWGLDGLRLRALDLALRRSGLRTLVLPTAVDVTRIGRALRALRPSAVVLGGRRAPLDVIGRLVYAVRGGVPAMRFYDFHGAVPEGETSTVEHLAETSVAARDRLLEALGAGGPGAPEVRAG